MQISPNHQFFIEVRTPSQCKTCGTTERKHKANNQCYRCFIREKVREFRAREREKNKYIIPKE